MVVDQNNIVLCPGNCLLSKYDYEEQNSGLPFKWSYRNGTMMLRDITTHGNTSSCTTATVGTSNVLTVQVSNDMVQHLMLGIPPAGLVQHSKRSIQYEKSTKLQSWKVATETLKALKHPGMCNVRVAIQCTSTLDQNNQLMHKGRDYQLVSFEVL